MSGLAAKENVRNICFVCQDESDGTKGWLTLEGGQQHWDFRTKQRREQNSRRCNSSFFRGLLLLDVFADVEGDRDDDDEALDHVVVIRVDSQELQDDLQ